MTDAATDRRRQTRLEFGAAEGQWEERRQRLGLALIAVDCDAELSRLCEYVFRLTEGGSAGSVIKPHDELAARPWRMCCSRAKARSTVSRAVSLGLIRRTEQRYISQGQRANAYEIDWQGIERILIERASGRRIPQFALAAACQEPGALPEHPPALPEHPGALPEHPPALPEHPYKEQEDSSNPPFENSSSTATQSASATWAAVEEALIAEGVTDFQGPIREAKRHVTPEHVLQVIAHYRGTTGYGAGALKCRVERCRPDLPPEANWPQRNMTTTTKPTPDSNERKHQFLEALLFRCCQEARRQGKPRQDAERMYLEKATTAGIAESEARQLID